MQGQPQDPGMGWSALRVGHGLIGHLALVHVQALVQRGIVFHGLFGALLGNAQPLHFERRGKAWTVRSLLPNTDAGAALA